MKLLSILVCMITILNSCKNNDSEINISNLKKEENLVSLTNAQFKNAGIETNKLKQQSVSTSIKVSGRIDVPPQNMVSISVPLGGYVKSTKLLPGMQINKNEVLAVIEDQQYIQLQQDYLTAKAQFIYNTSEYERQKELNKSKATSDKVFEQTKAIYQTQNVLIKSLEQKLALIGLNPGKLNANNITKTINLYSPINGFVSAVNVNIGKYVIPGDILFELVNPSDIHLTLTIFEKDIHKLYIGQKLLAYTNTYPEKKYPCTIILISKNVEKNNSMEVYCHFEQYDKTLLPGMFMSANIEVLANIANVLPTDALVRFESKPYAFIQTSDKHFKMIEVQTGNTENGDTEILNTEALVNEIFVTKGAYNLFMKLKNINSE